jgi:hypothetical protein
MKIQKPSRRRFNTAAYAQQCMTPLLPVPFALQREVFKHFDEDSCPCEDKIIHNKVAKAAKTNHCRSLVETVLSSWPLCPCCETSGYLVAALPQCVLSLLFSPLNNLRNLCNLRIIL